jgi:hypothetical protein
MFSPGSDLNVKNNEGRLTDICFYPRAKALTLKNEENRVADSLPASRELRA